LAGTARARGRDAGAARNTDGKYGTTGDAKLVFTRFFAAARRVFGYLIALTAIRKQATRKMNANR
jgi:hypothetical protein